MSPRLPLPENRPLGARDEDDDASFLDHEGADASPGPGEASARSRIGRVAQAFHTRTLALRTFLGATMFFGVVAATSYGLYSYVSTSARFAIKTLSVEGNLHRTTDQVAQAGGIKKGNNIFALDMETAANAMAQDPWIERAEVKRKLPSTVSIKVVERDAQALVEVGDTLFLASPAGDIFKKFELGDPPDLVLISGVSEVDGKPRDRQGLVALVKNAVDLANEYERFGPTKRYPLQEVHLSEDGRFELLVGRDTIRLALGKAPFRAKIERGARVLSEIDRRKGSASTIFLDNEAHPERVVARLR